MRTIHVLNLGAGVQSTDLYLRSAHGEIHPFDFAICSDTQDEYGAVHRRAGLADPEGSFYAHLEWLGVNFACALDSRSPIVRSSACGGPGCPILVRTKGQISADLLRGENSTGQRFATIPLYTATHEGGKEGQIQRQCTKEYKIEVIEQTIRREILGLDPGRRVPKDVVVVQHIGISWDERSRAYDIFTKRFQVPETEDVTQLGLFGEEATVSVVTGLRMRNNWRVKFDLIEDGRQITRSECQQNLRRWVPYEVQGSACVECPFKDDPTWAQHMREPATRDELIRIDTGIRTPGVILNRKCEEIVYLHRSCRPIDQIDFARERQMGFAMECEGGCGL